MDYHVSLEWICENAAVLRLHREPARVLGDAYVWSATLVRDGETAIFKGVMTAPPLETTKVMATALREAGFTRRAHERHKDGIVRLIQKRL